MKNLVLASLLGTLAGAAVVPAIGGPVHYQVTRPYSLFGMVPHGSNTVLGTAPLDFILTDVMVANIAYSFLVKVNGSPVLTCATSGNGAAHLTEAHLTSGIFIPAGSTISVEASFYNSTVPHGVTLAGYVQ